MTSMRQRAPPPVSPPSHSADNPVTRRRNRSGNDSVFSTSSWEISSHPSSEDLPSKQFQSVQYPNGLYQNHHRKHVALQNVHLFYRKPLHVSDAQYRAFLGMPRKPVSSGVSRTCCLHVCMAFSWVAVGFFLFVYIILKFQPLYIPHALPFQYQQINGKMVKVSDPSHSPLASVALHTLCAYLLVALLSQYYANPNRFRQQTYQDIPDHNTEAVKTDATLLPLTTSPIGVHQDSLCERTTGGLKQWMLLKGFRRGGKRKQFNTKTV